MYMLKEMPYYLPYVPIIGLNHACHLPVSMCVIRHHSEFPSLTVFGSQGAAPVVTALSDLIPCWSRR